MIIMSGIKYFFDFRYRLNTPGRNVNDKLALWLKTNNSCISYNYLPIRNKLWYLHCIKYVLLLDKFIIFAFMTFAKNASI